VKFRFHEQISTTRILSDNKGQIYRAIVYRFDCDNSCGTKRLTMN
jgi:hypothetical protein